MADNLEVVAEVAAEADAPVETGPAAPCRFGAAIDAWFADHIHNSPVSRATDAFNHLLSVLPHLKAKLAQEA